MTRDKPKYQQLFDAIEQGISSGRYSPGQKLPSEAALEAEFGISRITVVRALRELQQRGLVQRRAGSGTYVANDAFPETSMLFGLLIPNLGETEIFGPICQSMAEILQSRKHSLLWGNMTFAGEAKEAQSLELCEQYINKRVAGVFFAPLEWTPQHDKINRMVVSALQQANSPIVLLDRCFMPYPKRSSFDLVSVDHRQAGYLVAEHLLKIGCRRTAFVAYAHSASTIEARIAGYQEALLRAVGPVGDPQVYHLGSDEVSEIAQLMERLKPDGIACANDRTAGHVMRSLLSLGYRIPRDVRIVGIDDVQYAKLLPVSLTTVHQPCREIGVAAASAMLERLEMPHMPARDILLNCRLVVRDSCGANDLPQSARQ
jgi:GntR family transcriptional regulator, arabinose operon transcriptional repressor